MSTIIDIYIINVHPLIINDNIIWDVYYLTENSKILNCIRIYNILLSFLVARLPGYDLNHFTRYIESKVNDLKVLIRNDLKDGEYFLFENKREYAEIFSTNPKTLKFTLLKLERDLKMFYKRIDYSSLSSEDLLFYRNTETPFRFTSTTTSVSNSIYNLSTKYNVPLIGGAKLNISNLTKEFPEEFYPKIQGSMMGLDALTELHWNSLTVNNNITNAITRDDTVDFKRNMILMAYDIETYTRENMDPLVAGNYIFCIGIGFFDLTNQAPYKSICLISKDFDEIPNENITTIQKQKYERICYEIKNEYGSQMENDKAEYIIAKNESDLLKLYIKVIEDERPEVITGFNNYGFDDEFVYRRMEKYHLENEYLKLFSTYDIDDFDRSLSWFMPFKPVFQREILLKIDNDIRRDNNSVKAWSVLTTDVYKLMLKEDPKRFTLYGRGNLNTMLEVYEVKNPFNNSPLSKTDMKIQTMFNLWDLNKEIYKIGLYCRQDAWITGTLLIKRSKLGDLIETASTSYTTFSDSIYRADGIRVNNSIIAYAYHDGYAFKDEAYKDRGKILKENADNEFLGGKKFDTRTIVGGAVRNLNPGRQKFVVALDFSSMYPALKESSFIDSSSRVDDDIIENPSKYGLKIVDTKEITDMYGTRKIFYIS